MYQWIGTLGDICVIIFDLLLYSRMIALRKKSYRGIMIAGCVVIVAFYMLAVLVLNWPISLAAFACMTLPSLALFWTLCKHRDARFLLTFCFVDTLSTILGFFVRLVWLYAGTVGSILSIVFMVLLFALVFKVGDPYLKRYREVLDFVETGWKRLAFSAAMIYIFLIFVAAYPSPLIQRLEYVPVYLVMSCMILSFYVVLLTNIAMTKKVYDQAMRLQEQQKWFNMAYSDALTGIPNRMAYMEKTHNLERTEDPAAPAAIVVMDLDHFKEINDTWGHTAGDEALKTAAGFLTALFSDEGYTVYRIGGDEFAVIALGVEEPALMGKLEALGGFRGGDIPCSISAGYAFVDRREKNAVERAFSRADSQMYARRGRSLDHRPEVTE